MSTTTYKDAVSRVKDFQKTAAAAKAANATDQANKGNPKGATIPEQDPNEKGTVTPPKQPGEAPAAQNLPDTRTEGQYQAHSTPESLNQLKPGETGKEVPTTVDGKPKEEAATSPTVELSKIAGDASAIAQRFITLRKSAGVAAPAGAVSTTNVKPVTAPTAATPGGAKAATADLPNRFGTDMLVKLATELLATEDGVALAERVLLKSAGAETARNLLQAAVDQNAELLKAASAHDEQAQAEQAWFEHVDAIYKNASAEDRAVMDKIASVHAAAIEKIVDPLEQLAYKQGAMDAASMMDSQGGDPSAQPQLPGGEQGPASIEQIAQLLQQAVQSGELDEQTATQILQELATAEGGAGGGGAPGGDPTGGAPGGGPGGPGGGDPTGGMPGGDPTGGAGAGGPPMPEAPAAGDPAELAKAASLFKELMLPKK